jgi:hypothetical protein
MNSPEVRRAKPTVEFLPVELDGSHVGILSVESPGVRDEWEMHPEQDELLYLLRGAVDVFLRVDLEGTEDQAIYFLKGDACLIPKGMVAQTSRCLSMQDVASHSEDYASAIRTRVRVGRQLTSESRFTSATRNGRDPGGFSCCPRRSAERTGTHSRCRGRSTPPSAGPKRRRSSVAGAESRTS